MSVYSIEVNGTVVPLCGINRIRRRGGEVVKGCDIYIGRQQTQGGWNLEGSKWQNPFKIGKDHTATDVCQKYYDYVKNGPLMADIEELRGKVLGCWCDIVESHGRTLEQRLEKPQCHGEVLLKLLAENTKTNVY